MKYLPIFIAFLLLVSSLQGCKKSDDPTASSGGTTLPDTRNTLVCFIDGGNLVGADAKTGIKKWTYTTGGGGSSAPVIYDGVVFVGSADNNLYAIDATTGQKKWAFNTTETVRTSPTVANGVVFVNSGRKLFAINAASGILKWTYTFDTNVSFYVNSPTVFQGSVYVTTLLPGNGGLEIINAETGKGEYAYITNSTNFGSPTVASNGNVFWGSNESMYAMARNPNRIISSPASFGTSAIYYGTSPTARNGSVFIGDRLGNFYCFNATTGTEIWKFAAGGTFDRLSCPVVGDGLVFFATGTKLFAANASTGTQKWELTFYASIGHTVANGVLYAGHATDKKLYAIDAQTGKTIWAIDTESGASRVCVLDISKTAYQCGNSGSEP